MTYRRKPCAKCPFRRDVKPYLHPDRAAEIAYASENPYSDFTCHETVDYSDSEDGEGMVTEKSLTCAGFKAMQHNYCGSDDEYEWPGDVYCEPDEMVSAYEDAWAEKRL